MEEELSRKVVRKNTFEFEYDENVITTVTFDLNYNNNPLFLDEDNLNISNSNKNKVKSKSTGDTTPNRSLDMTTDNFMDQFLFEEENHQHRPCDLNTNMTSIVSSLNNFKIKELQFRERENLINKDKIVFNKRPLKELIRNVNHLQSHLVRYLPHTKKEGKFNIKATKKEI